MWSFLSLLAILALRVKATDSDYLSVSDAFRINGIKGLITPEVPKIRLTVIAGDYFVNLGNYIPAFETIGEPLESWNANDNGFYTIINFDPDSPQVFQNNGTVFLHGMIVNIPGLNIQRGNRLAPYVPAFSEPGSGFHRFIGFVYRQQRRIDVTLDLLISVSTNFYNFRLADFVSLYGLGPPIFGNFFRSQLTTCKPNVRNGSRITSCEDRFTI